MTGPEQGFLLLTSSLGDPERKPLTVAQTRELRNRVSGKETTTPDREMLADDLTALGYSADMAQRMISLLGEKERLLRYLQKAKRRNCIPLTPVSPGYPKHLIDVLGGDCPGCVWAKGDLSLLQLPAISLVGSRELSLRNEVFAREVGKQAALQGYVLISGNARGADRCAQEACLEYGGRVISVVADELQRLPRRDGILYLSEDSFDLSFSAQRALSRNRLIHALGEKTFVAQSSYQTGGTWDGTVKNLKKNWSAVYVFADGTMATRELTQMGATEIAMEDLADLSGLYEPTPNLFHFT